ncbi:glycoside hydrolase family 27 protein [Maribellus sp. CM-23]|uniref:glycoside hydrolase family 27 protein n=1 Tax=Maribellus sp. CM-23 TaxID=2781026 RepID=UPI001F1827F2|nr:glycoside hydrolase family 27 protein [Maribellus sp. CM-23]MCE4567035.1 glycoside hydrolase family 27 protein [Maribellus sp. CM-23]
MKKHYLLLLSIFFFVNGMAQKFDMLAQTPPMGWNSWNKFGCDVDEKLIMDIADALVSSGMKDVGYEYVVIDDCWQVGRDENGEIVIDKERFPNGIKYLADYIHSKGLKFGIYSCAGEFTCAGRPGSRGYEFQDARTYASWGVDYLKYDWCYTTDENVQCASSAPEHAISSYTTMSDALFAAGRPVVFSICEWGFQQPWEWGENIGHLWRTYHDIKDRWDSVLEILDKQKGLERHAGPGHWNDPDMLEVGNGGMTNEEYKSHFSLWCMLAAPLMAGNDIQNMTAETKEILTNKELIAVNQDVLGIQAFCYRDNGDYEIWIKKLANNERVVCLLNRSDENKKVQVDFDLLLKVTNNHRNSEPNKLEDYKVRDLWEHEDLKINESTSYINIAPHSVKVFRYISELRSK